MPNREILASPDIAESEEGAVLLNSGYTALGKVMAGSGGCLLYTSPSPRD